MAMLKWKMRDGKTIPFKVMSDHHLERAIEYFGSVVGCDENDDLILRRDLMSLDMEERIAQLERERRRREQLGIKVSVGQSFWENLCQKFKL